MRKYRTWHVALCAVAGTISMTAQPSPDHGKQHVRYLLVNLGTFGGPTSGLNCCGDVPPVLNDRGTVTGSADTSQPNPNFTNFNPRIGSDPYLSTGFKWQNGRLTSLKPLSGGFNTTTGSINAYGAISGNSEVGEVDPILGVPGCHAALWDKDSVVGLRTLEGGYESLAFAINDNNLVVGAAANTIPDSFSTFLYGWSTQTRAFLWRNGVMRDLGTLGGNDAAANYVNDEGQIIGTSFTDTVANPNTGLPTQDPFLWEKGKKFDLGSLGGAYGFPSGINNRGVVVGLSDLAGDITYHPFAWDRGVITDLGTLGGDNGYALGVNDAAEIVGRADLPGSAVHHAFLWKHGKMTDLGVPPGGGQCSTAFSINSAGQVIGDSGVCGVGGNPFLWEQGVIYDLRSLVVPGFDLTLSDVDYQVNGSGEIACLGTLANGDTHACLLVPCDKDHAAAKACAGASAHAADVTRISPSVISERSPNMIHGGSERALSGSAQSRGYLLRDRKSRPN